MLLAAGAAILLKPTQRLADFRPQVDLETAIPKQFGEWQMLGESDRLIVSPDVQANLDRIYDQILSRTYISKRGQQVMLWIAYGRAQTHELKAHRQEACYAAQGFQISSLAHGNLTIGQSRIPMTHMLAAKDAQIEAVTYWFTMGDTAVLTRMGRLLMMIRYALSGLVPDGFLVRVSDISIDEKHSYALHEEFIDEMSASLKPSLLQRLIGLNP
jgi:EpsI family protein